VTGFYQPPMEYKASLLLYHQAAPSYATQRIIRRMVKVEMYLQIF